MGNLHNIKNYISRFKTIFSILGFILLFEVIYATGVLFFPTPFSFVQTTAKSAPFSLVKTAYAEECNLDSDCNDNFTYCDSGKTILKNGGYCGGDKQCVYNFADQNVPCGGTGSCNPESYNSCDYGGCSGFAPKLPNSVVKVTRNCDASGNATYSCVDLGQQAGQCGYTAPGATCPCEYTDKASWSGHNECTTGYAIYSGNCTAPSYNPSCSAFKRCATLDCPAGTTKQPKSNDGQPVDWKIVDSSGKAYSGTGVCGYMYWHYDPVKSVTLVDGSGCFVQVFTQWQDQTKCPKTATTPKPSASAATGACTVTGWTFSNTNPAPNTLIRATVKGVSDTGGWQYMVYKKDSEAWVTPKFDITDGPIFSFDVNSGTAGTHTVTLGTSNGATTCSPKGTFTTGGGASPTSTPTPPAVTTVKFRIAENPTDLNTAAWQNYTSHPMPADYEIKDIKPGVKTIWVEFQSSDGKTEIRSRQIRILGTAAAVASCVLNLEGANAVLTLRGENFGSLKGSVKGDNTALQIREWKDGEVSVVWPNAPVGKTLNVALTNSDGQTAPLVSCSSLSQLALGAKVFCRAPSNHQTDNVEMVLAEAFEGGKKTKQTVSIDKDGLIIGLNQKLATGKNYILSLDGRFMLRRQAKFTAGEGTTNIANFVLPIGDIFPEDGGDGKINTLDKAELNKQWVIDAPAQNRVGDFNQDDRVNSIDWACMRYDFGLPEDPEPEPGGPPAPSPSATNASPSPSATAKVSPSPSGQACAQVITPAKNTQTGECKEFPTPCDVPGGWEKVGSCSNVSPSPSPNPTVTQVVSLSPQNVSSNPSIPKLWTTTFSNSVNYQNIRNAFILISVNGSNNPATDPTFHYAYYSVPTNKFYVWDPNKAGGAGWIGGFTPGAEGARVAVNAFGLIPLLNGIGTNTNGTGDKNLIVNWYIVTSGGAAGKTYKIFLRAQGNDGTDTKWVEKGSWTIN